MQARGRRVVRDSHLGPESAQRIERRALGRARVRRRQDAQVAPRIGMAPERLEKRAHARAANERHHHVDAVRGRDLGDELATDARLAGGIREKRGVQQRDERFGDRLAAAVGKPCEDGMQDRGRCHGRILIRRGVVNGAADLFDEPASECRRDGDAFLSATAARARWIRRPRCSAIRSGASAARSGSLAASQRSSRPCNRAWSASVISSSYRPRGWSGMVGAVP